MWELLLRSRKFIIGLAVVGAIVMFGIIGPMVTQEPQIDMKKMNLPPGNEYLGTTSFGEDVFAQLCRGIRNSLMVGVLGGGLGTLIAVLLGALGPYKGGLADEISSFVTNVIMVFPVLPLLLFLAYVLQERSLFLVGLLIALTSWPWAARCIRSQVLSLKEREFINLARISGMKDRTTVITEVLPNMLAYILMVFVLLTGGAIMVEAGMSAVGVGPNRFQSVTLGNMIYSAIQYHSGVPHWSYIWWWFIPPGIVLTILLSAVFFMHAGMDEVFNPRLRKV
jgi:peptide/nickel transport system permease protein